MAGRGWAYRHPARDRGRLRRRQAGCPAQTLARSWKAQRRLHAAYAKLGAGRSARWRVTATARELAGFVWAELTK